MTAFAALEPKYMASSTYNARHDPDIFDIVTDHLRRHRGEWVHIEDVFSVDPWLARGIVAAARHIGDVIVTRGQGRPGYMYVGYCRGRWVQESSIGSLHWRGREERSSDTPGQLTLAQEGVG